MYKCSNTALSRRSVQLDPLVGQVRYIAPGHRMSTNALSIPHGRLLSQLGMQGRNEKQVLHSRHAIYAVLYSTRPFSPPIIIKQVFLLLCLHLGNSTTVHRSFPTCRDP